MVDGVRSPASHPLDVMWRILLSSEDGVADSLEKVTVIFPGTTWVVTLQRLVMQLALEDIFRFAVSVSHEDVYG